MIYEEVGLNAMLTLADNIHEGVNPQGEDCWYADLYTMTLTRSDALRERIENNFGLYLAEAKRRDEEQQRQEEMEKATLNNDEVAEILGDHELRICLMELGVNEGDL